MTEENKDPYYKVLIWIQEEDKEIVIGNFQSIIISIRDPEITTTEKLLEGESQIAFVLEHGVLFKPLWEQYKQGIYQRSRRFNITYPTETGRYELRICCCDEVKFSEINGVKTEFVSKIEGLAERFSYFHETWDEFKKES